MSKIIKQVPPVKTFDLPAGQFTATLSQVKSITKQAKRGPQDWVRLIFQVQVPTLQGLIPMAGRNFLLDLNPGSDLRNFLEIWLGKEYFQSISGQDLDFDTLVGRDGDICLSHYQGDNYDRPHVNIDNVYTPGTLQLREAEPVKLAPKSK